jgi:hypothetical protein
MVCLREAAVGGWYVPSYHPFVLFFQVFDASIPVHDGLDLYLMVGEEKKKMCV